LCQLEPSDADETQSQYGRGQGEADRYGRHHGRIIVRLFVAVLDQSGRHAAQKEQAGVLDCAIFAGTALQQTFSKNTL
jgi:hypothetical protein